jgi:hypothetical protein
MHGDYAQTLRGNRVKSGSTAVSRSIDGLGTRALTKVENRRKSKHSLYLAFIYLLCCYHKNNYELFTV